MKNKTVKTLKNLLYTAIPLSIASFLPVKEANSQPNRMNLNTISLILQGGDLGTGIRYDRRFQSLYPFGVYTSISKGFESDDYIKDHFKFGLGIMRYQKGSYSHNFKTFFGAGLAYHTYGNNKEEYEQLDRKELYKPISGDAIVGTRKGRLFSFIDIDPLKKHGSIGAGISFGGVPQRRRAICKVYSK